MKNDSIEKQDAIFKKPRLGMKSHLKPLFIKAKVDNNGVNKVLADSHATFNLMSHSLLRRIWKFNINLGPYNMFLLNFEGKIGHYLGEIQVDFVFGTTIRPTLFMVVPFKANYNLLIGKDCIHGVDVVPSSLHLRISIWR